LKDNKIKNIKLPVSAPFHCELMTKATEIMRKELDKVDFKKSNNKLVSNVTADEILDVKDLKNLLISQIEKRVRWRESIINMINHGVSQFIEIGPGKVLSGLIKRINKNVKTTTINNQSDIESLRI
jgi:[acyl-carrier-protein] S-malonyltransferase